ncbi:MAG: protease inhibitor I42 family protein, partial [Chloroflexota bacterium]
MALRSLLTTLLCASTLAACSTSQAAAPAGATCEQFGSTPSIAESRTIGEGTDLTVVLCANPSTGYAWDDPVIGDPAVIEVIERTYRAPDASSLPIVGAAGGEVLTVHGLASGTTTLSIRYSQP